MTDEIDANLIIHRKVKMTLPKSWNFCGDHYVKFEGKKYHIKKRDFHITPTSPDPQMFITLVEVEE